MLNLTTIIFGSSLEILGLSFQAMNGLRVMDENFSRNRSKGTVAEFDWFSENYVQLETKRVVRLSHENCFTPFLPATI